MALKRSFLFRVGNLNILIFQSELIENFTDTGFRKYEKNSELD
jgi:hypothetical protein